MHVFIHIECILLQRSVLICPGQKIIPESYPLSNFSDKTIHSEVAITQPGVINYTVLIENSCHCAADFVIVASDRDVEMETVFFSKSLIHMVWYLLKL